MNGNSPGRPRSCGPLSGGDHGHRDSGVGATVARHQGSVVDAGRLAVDEASVRPPPRDPRPRPAVRDAAGARRAPSVEVELAEGSTAGDVWASLGIGEEPPALGVAVEPRLRRPRDRAGRRRRGGVHPAGLRRRDRAVRRAHRRADRPGRGSWPSSRAPGAGAIATFSGTVRDHSRDRDVERLEYEIYPEMAIAELTRIAARGGGAARPARDRRRAPRRALRDRRDDRRDRLLGAAPRPGAGGLPRDDRRARSRPVPIWKREVYRDGAAWIGQGS